MHMISAAKCIHHKKGQVVCCWKVKYNIQQFQRFFGDLEINAREITILLTYQKKPISCWFHGPSIISAASNVVF